MAHVMNRTAIGAGAVVWLQSYDDQEYSMVLNRVTVEDVQGDGVLFQAPHGFLCGWDEDYNYRFGWRCWDGKPSSEELARVPFEM